MNGESAHSDVKTFEELLDTGDFEKKLLARANLECMTLPSLDIDAIPYSLDGNKL